MCLLLLVGVVLQIGSAHKKHPVAAFTGILRSKDTLPSINSLVPFQKSGFGGFFSWLLHLPTVSSSVLEKQISGGSHKERDVLSEQRKSYSQVVSGCLKLLFSLNFLSILIHKSGIQMTGLFLNM